MSKCKCDGLEPVEVKVEDEPYPVIEDEDEVLDTIVQALTSKRVDVNKVKRAVKQAVYNYENQLRVFMVAVANTQLKRIMNLLQSIDFIESRLTHPDVIRSMDAKSLIKYYALQQSHLVQSLDYVKRVVDMRMELQQAAAAVTSTLSASEIDEIDQLSGLPKLDAQQRSKVRLIIEGLIDEVDRVGE